jgi:hypothetical protein
MPPESSPGYAADMFISPTARMMSNTRQALGTGER